LLSLVNGGPAAGREHDGDPRSHKHYPVDSTHDAISPHAAILRPVSASSKFEVQAAFFSGLSTCRLTVARATRHTAIAAAIKVKYEALPRSASAHGPA
jgi:hypothetical protein